MIKTTDENGGILGVDNTPTRAVASGIWNLNTIATARHDDIWPTSDFYTFPIGQSLRFDGSSYLSRTFGTPTDSSTWTYSLWIKRTMLGSNSQLVLWTGSTPVNDSNLGFTAANKFEWYSRASSNQTGYVTTTALYRDTSAWYHFVISFDHDDSSSIKFYANGNQVTVFDNSAYPSSAQTLNTSLEHRIGSRNYTSSNYFNGYLAEINFLDGYVPTTGNGGLDSSGNLQVLGETKNGVWTPKNPSGLSYGTNGFRLTFSDATSTTTLGYDSSGNSNHWTLN